MPTELALPALVGLLPVLCFLAALLYLDSYKLVRAARGGRASSCAASVVAGACYVVNAGLLTRLDVRPRTLYALRRAGHRGAR